MTKKRLALVTGHFPPSNLPGVHRARLWAQHLREFGWEPVVVTAHPDYYEEKPDPALLELVSQDLRVIRTRALPVKPVRLAGDIGLRAFYWLFKEVDRLVKRREVDFVVLTIPSNYVALIGELLRRRHRVPFAVDFQDPWVEEWSGSARPFSKAWLSGLLARGLEPWAVRNASLITGVAPLYYEGVLKRNPHLRNQCVTASMPIGNSGADYQALAKTSRPTFLFSRDDGMFHMVYAGAMWGKAQAVFERLLEALVVMRDSDPQTLARLRIHFVGTGKSRDDPTGYNVLPHVERFGLQHWVSEHPSRISYVDVLNHLANASAVLILGSTEAHYTPSKVYQSVESQRPIFALLHEKCTAVTILRDSRAGRAVTLTEERLPDPRTLASELASFIRDPQYSPDQVRWDLFEEHSARNSTRLLVEAVEQALKRHDEHCE